MLNINSFKRTCPQMLQVKSLIFPHVDLREDVFPLATPPPSY